MPDEAVEAPVGPRDVWRAARARRRALRAEIRRFTQRARRRRRAWLVAAALLLLVIGGSAAAAYSPLFAVERITVIGATTVDPSVIEEALEGQKGVPLALVDAAAVKDALAVFPVLESYALEARPPHELAVRIVERTPVGVLETEEGFTVVDAAGVVLQTTPERPGGFALIDGSVQPGSAAFEAIGHVMRAVPEGIRAQIDVVRASTADDVTLVLAGEAEVLWGNADRSAEKVMLLERLMQIRPPEPGAFYDVSSAETAVIG